MQKWLLVVLLIIVGFAAAMIAFGMHLYDQKLRTRDVNIVDFTHPGSRAAWKAEHVFSDPDMAAMARAIQEGNTESIRQSLANNVPIDGVGKDDVTPLAWAYMVRNKPAFRFLLEQNANPNIYIGSLTLMSLLARNEEDSQWLELALRHRGDPNIVDKSNVTFFSKQTPIFGAIHSMKKENLELLIKAGADLNHKDMEGDTPALAAATHFRFDSVYYLLEAGADPTIHTRNGMSLPFLLMCHAVEPGEELQEWREKALTLLEKRGFDLREEASKIPNYDDRERWLHRLEGRPRTSKTPARTIPESTKRAA